METLLSAFASPGDTANIFLTPFLRCTIFELVHHRVLTSHAAYHGGVPPIYVDVILSLKKPMCSMFVQCDVLIYSAQVVSKNMRHAYSVIRHGIRNYLSRRKDQTEVLEVPSLLRRRTDKSADSSAAHVALQSANNRKFTRRTTPQENPTGKILNMKTTTYDSGNKAKSKGNNTPTHKSASTGRYKTDLRPFPTEHPPTDPGIIIAPTKHSLN